MDFQSLKEFSTYGRLSFFSNLFNLVLLYIPFPQNFHNISLQDFKGCNSMREPIIPENEVFLEMLGKTILLVTESKQLNILGQTFRPIFSGKVVEVTNGYITLDPAIIKMHNAPFYKFPTPLSFPMEAISVFTEFDPDRRIPLI